MVSVLIHSLWFYLHCLIFSAWERDRKRWGNWKENRKRLCHIVWISSLWNHPKIKKKKLSLIETLLLRVPSFPVNLHKPKYLKNSQGRVRSEPPPPPPPIPSAPPPLFHAQSIWNVHVESIKASQMAERAGECYETSRIGASAAPGQYLKVL